jgi:hypothetical protein
MSDQNTPNTEQDTDQNTEDVQVDPYVKFLKENIRRTVAQTRTQLDDVRPLFHLSNWKDVPTKLKEMNSLFARMDIILQEVRSQVERQKDN